MNLNVTWFLGNFACYLNLVVEMVMKNFRFWFPFVQRVNIRQRFFFHNFIIALPTLVWLLLYYRPQRSCGQGNIFTPVCHSVHRGGVSEADPPGSRPPGSKHSPPGQTPLREQTSPGSRPPPGADPPTPPGLSTPQPPRD